MLSVRIIAQTIGLFATIVSLICFHRKSQKGILKIKLFMDILWGIHVNSYAGMLSEGLSLLSVLIALIISRGETAAKE